MEKNNGKDPASPDRRGKVSLRQVDALLLGELPEAEAARLRQELEADPLACAYLERQAALGSGLSLADIRRGIERKRAEGWLVRLRGWVVSSAGAAFTRPLSLTSRPSRAAWTLLGACASLAMGIALWTAGPKRLAVPESGLTAKGNWGPEVRISVRGRTYSPGDLLPARAGDTLAFSFRSPESSHVQIWYREGEGELRPFSGREAFSLPPATAWMEAPQRVLLDGKWSRQEVWFVLSREALDQKEAVRAIRRGPGPGLVQVQAFRLVAE